MKSELWKCIWHKYDKTTGATRRDASKGMALKEITIYNINILIKATVSLHITLNQDPETSQRTSPHKCQHNRHNFFGTGPSSEECRFRSSSDLTGDRGRRLVLVVPRWPQVSEFRLCACCLAEWLDWFVDILSGNIYWKHLKTHWFFENHHGIRCLLQILQNASSGKMDNEWKWYNPVEVSMRISKWLCVP